MYSRSRDFVVSENRRFLMVFSLINPPGHLYLSSLLLVRSLTPLRSLMIFFKMLEFEF